MCWLPLVAMVIGCLSASSSSLPQNYLSGGHVAMQQYVTEVTSVSAQLSNVSSTRLHNLDNSPLFLPPTPAPPHFPSTISTERWALTSFSSGGLSLDDSTVDNAWGVTEQELELNSHPRVLLSKTPPVKPPLLFLLEEQTDVSEEQQVHDSWPRQNEERLNGTMSNRGRRFRRSNVDPARRGDLSVCDAVSDWVTDKKTAIDIHGRMVTIVPEVQTLTGPLKQYFYETRCNRTHMSRPGCRGVDRRQWLSECKAKQSFVRALTVSSDKLVGWRWIRIDTSCVCVLLSRTGRT
ncbi:neurotrophin-4-like [Erpetoichthys calabaricus]|uniref:neurotrophin-4-like n=1 Tax=Erpetoichthys calabaricus TaxID=27687 RepID=UPI0010A08071|nr:neurotrophin-4-like [Erpetoichthys calabaricus]